MPHLHSHTQNLHQTLEAETKHKLVCFIEPIKEFVSSYRTAYGQPAQTIINMKNQIGADLIITGSVGEGGIATMLGSVARKLVNTCDDDLLILKSSQ